MYNDKERIDWQRQAMISEFLFHQLVSECGLGKLSRMTDTSMFKVKDNKKLTLALNIGDSALHNLSESSFLPPFKVMDHQESKVKPTY